MRPIGPIGNCWLAFLDARTLDIVYSIKVLSSNLLVLPVLNSVVPLAKKFSLSYEFAHGGEDIKLGADSEFHIDKA